MTIRVHTKQLYAFCAGSVSWLALLVQLGLSVGLAQRNGHTALYGVGVYVSYFTILTNLLVAVTFSTAALTSRTTGVGVLNHPSAATGVATSITVVCLGYNLLLRHLWRPMGLQWLADELLHDVVPALYLIYWYRFVAAKWLPWADVVLWAFYPLGYLGYALARGRLAGSYPYPFLDLNALGPGAVAVNATALFAAFIVVAALFVALGHWKQTPETPEDDVSPTELKTLFEGDRADRAGGVRVGTPEYAAMRRRDRERRERVAALVAARALKTPEEFYYAACIYNHGETADDAWQAHRLAWEAAEKGFHAARWMTAASYDRWLMYQGQPQKYGTQFVSDGQRQRLWDVAPDTSDEERALWDVPTLAEQLARADEATRRNPGQLQITEDAPGWLKDAMVRWGLPIAPREGTDAGDSERLPDFPDPGPSAADASDRGKA